MSLNLIAVSSYKQHNIIILYEITIPDYKGIHHYVIMKIIRIESDFIKWIKIIILFYKYVIEVRNYRVGVCKIRSHARNSDRFLIINK